MATKALLRRPLVWLGLGLWLTVAAALMATVMLPAGPAAARLPAPLGHVPPFSLVDEQGRTVGSDALRGQPYVANFVFTRCQSVCPLLSQRMAAFQRRSAEAGVPVTLLSFSVDPEFDTPQVLRAYGRRVGAEPGRWRFLTGDRAAVRAVVVDGFGGVMEPMANGAGAREPVDIAHSQRFVVVDGEGAIRGTFAPDSDGQAAMLELVRQLTAAGGNA